MRNICIDSRELKPGDVFIPLKGNHHDGHAFINEALKKGATILDVDLPNYAKQYRKKLRCAVIGITGSAGKTTTKDLLAAVLSQKFNVVKTIENQNNEIGVPITILRADYSTDILIVEMAMRNKGEIGYLSNMVRPTHSIVTSIGMTHIENFKSQKDIAKAKAEIFKPAPSWQTQTRYAYLNHTTPFYEYLKAQAEKTNHTIFPFGGQDKPDQNINLCYAIGHQFGLNDTEILEGLKTYQSSSHRLKVIPFEEITIIDDSYNANPDGVTYSLQFLRRFSGRKIFVLGDMLELGDYSQSAHQDILPQAINAGVEVMFTLGQHSAQLKSEDLSIDSFLEKQKLNITLLNELKPGDVVLIKGSRGMKMEETVHYIHEHYRAT